MRVNGRLSGGTFHKRGQGHAGFLYEGYMPGGGMRRADGYLGLGWWNGVLGRGIVVTCGTLVVRDSGRGVGCWWFFNIHFMPWP